MNINPETAFEFDFFNHSITVATSVVTQWVVMAIIIGLVLLLTRNLGKVPSRRQTVLEMLVSLFNGLVSTNMGNEYKKAFVPFIGALGIYICTLNLTGLVGVKPPTMDINVTFTFAMFAFVIINVNAIRQNGFRGYLHGYIKPFAPMLPLNIIEKVTIPLSLCLRLFINMLVGVIIIELVYQGLGWFAFAIPVPLHFFFDLFVGLVQTFVFMMLTMVYIKTAASE